MRIHLHPFRLGLATYDYGVVIRWFGLYRAIGRNRHLSV